MDIQVIRTNDTTYPHTGRQVLAELRCGKHHATVWISEGKGVMPPSVRVIVHNASNQVWRQLGKTFPTAAQAIANYKTPEIRAMIEHVVDDAHAAHLDA